MKRRRTAALLSLTALIGTAFTTVPAQADEVEQVRNGTFDTTTEPWWTSSNVTAGLSGGRLCADVPGGTANRWDAAVGQNDLRTRGARGSAYRLSPSTPTDTPVGPTTPVRGPCRVGLVGGPVRHLVRRSARSSARGVRISTRFEPRPVPSPTSLSWGCTQ
ncbi:hypothetical protein SGLAM104S_01834 [Streptomyces glaucescens]